MVELSEKQLNEKIEFIKSYMNASNLAEGSNG